MNRDLVRLHRECQPALKVGQEWWTDTPHALAARVRVERSRGTVVELTRVELAPGVHGAIIQRLKPRPPAWRKPLLMSVGLGLVVTSVIMVLAHFLITVALRAWPLVLGLALIYMGVRIVGGHRPTCTGLHCPGCRH